ncbi:MAG: glycosyltransferase family 39 protein [Alphaproteobacteria bacterium]
MADKRTPWLLLGAILALAAVLRLYNLGGAEFWGDEQMAVASQYRSVGEIIRERVELDPYINIEPPGYHLLNKAAILIVPDPLMAFDEIGRIWLRMISALAGVLAVLLMYLLARRFTGDRSALLPALLLAFSFYAIYYSQENRPYSLVIALSLLTTWLFVEAFFHRRRWLALPYALGIAVVCYLHYTAVMLPLIHTTALLVCTIARWRPASDDDYRLGWRDLACFAAAGLLALALYSPWLPYTLRMALNPTQFYEPAALQTDAALIAQARANIALSTLTHWGCDGYPSFFTYVPLLILGLVHAFRRSRALGALSACFYLVPLIYLYASPYAMYLHPRYLSFVYPLHQLLAGLGLVELFTLLKKPLAKITKSPAMANKLSRAAIVVLLAIMLAQNALGLVPYYRNSIKCTSTSNIRFCAEYIELFYIWQNLDELEPLTPKAP